MIKYPPFTILKYMVGYDTALKLLHSIGIGCVVELMLHRTSHYKFKLKVNCMTYMIELWGRHRCYML